MITESYEDGFSLCCHGESYGSAPDWNLLGPFGLWLRIFFRHAGNMVHLARLTSKAKPSAVVRSVFLHKERFLVLFPCAYFYFVVIDGRCLTVCLIARLAKLRLVKYLWLRSAECLNADLSGALPTIKIHRFKLDTFKDNAVHKKS